MASPNVAVGLRRGRVIVNATYSPGPGTYVDSQPVFESSSSDTEAIGRNVQKALAEFSVGGEMPDWSVYRSPVLDVAKVRTWGEYEKGLKGCVIGQNGDNLVMRGDHPVITLALDAPAEDIGKAVLSALGTCKDKELKKHAKAT